MHKTVSILALRSLCVALILVFVAAVYTELNFPISEDSQRYQDGYPDLIRSGLSFSFLLSKVAWGAGCLSGVLGVVLTIFSKRSGFVPIAVAAPSIALGSYLQAPPSYLPSVEPMPALLLWCLTSAIWGGVVVLTWLRTPNLPLSTDDPAGRRIAPR